MAKLCALCGLIIMPEDDVCLYEGNEIHADCMPPPPSSYSKGKKTHSILPKDVQANIDKSRNYMKEVTQQALRADIPQPNHIIPVGYREDKFVWDRYEAPRTFDTGATRDKDETKLDFEGFLSPRVIKAFAEYMHKNREMKDGSVRASDNWQKGIPFDSYIKSAWRHFFDWWAEHRGLYSRDGLTDALCGLLFNVSGYLHEHLKRIENENKNIRSNE